MKKLIFICIGVLSSLLVTSQGLNSNWLRLINQGKSSYAVNQYSVALTYFSAASKLIPTDTVAYIYMLDCAYKTQNVDVFFDSFDKLLILNHQSARAYDLAIQMAINVEKNYQKAVQYVEAAKLEFPDSKVFLFADINIYYKYGDFDASLNKLSAFVEKFPQSKFAYNMQFDIYYNIKHDAASALQTLEKAMRYFPYEQEYVKKMVNIYIETNQMDAAEEKFMKLIQLNPNEAKHYYNLSLILYNKGEYEKSVQYASQAIAIKPDYLEAIYNLGTFFYYRALTYNEALMKMTPYQYTYQGQGRGVENTAKSYFEAAKPYFQKAIGLNTNELGAYENMNTINALLDNINKNQQLTTPYFVNLENEDIHKIYPDYELSDFKLHYPNNKSFIQKGQEAELVVTLKNVGQEQINDLKFNMIEPFVNPMFEYQSQYMISGLNAGTDTTLHIPIKYLQNNPNTVGVERTDDSKVLIRFFAAGNDQRYTDLQQIEINTGVEQFVAEIKSGFSSETIDIDFSPIAKATNFLLVIGMDQYNKWPALTNAVSDAKRFRDVLLSKYDVDKQNIFELYDKDATKDNIINELIKIKGELGEDDNLIIYYAGHGDYNTENDEGSWVPINASLDMPNEYLDNKTLLGFLNALNTKHTFLIADACFSGSLFVSDDDMTYKPNNDKIKSRWGFTSGNIEYVADGQVGEGSPFANYLVEVLDENEQEFIAVTELISYVKFKVRNNALQTPIGRPLKLEGNQGGEFLLYTR